MRALGISPTVVGLQFIITDRNTILIIALVLVESIILIDILYIGSRLVRGIVTLCLVITGRRVSLRIIDTLIAIHDTGLRSIKVGTTVIMIVVAGRVLSPSLKQGIIMYHITDIIQPVSICAIGSFFFICQTIETHILLLAGAAGGSEGVGLRSLHGNLTPLGCLKRRGAINRHTTLVELLAITQHILAHLTKVDIQLTTMFAGSTFLTGIDEGIEQPELYIFYIRLFEVGSLQLTHHTTPALGWITERTVAIVVKRQVVRTTFLRVISQVQDGQCRHGTVIGTLVTVRIEFLHIDLTHIVVGQLVQVVLDMRRCQTG